MKPGGIAVLGDGGWGTSLAIMLHKKGERVRLWGAFEEYIAEMKRTRENRKYLAGIPIPPDLAMTDDLAVALDGASIAVLAIPSKYMRGVVREVAALEPERTLFLSVAKGLEEDTLMRMSEVILDELGPVDLAVLSGPNLSQEVARGMPSAATVSSSNADVARAVQRILMGDTFRLYTNDDIIGVELGGALKNCVAIAAGVVDGLGLGTNSKSALLTRGLVEITRLGVVMGARASTFSGLSGLGDLATTCFSTLSRNHTLGYRIGRGETVEAIVASTEMVFEGIKTSKAARRLALKHQVEMPIIFEVYAVLYEGKSPRESIQDLMTRAPRAEMEEVLE